MGGQSEVAGERRWRSGDGGLAGNRDHEETEDPKNQKKKAKRTEARVTVKNESKGTLILKNTK